MYKVGRRTVLRALAAASLGLLIGTGLLSVLLTVSSFIQGLTVADLFSNFEHNPLREPSQVVLVLGRSLLLVYVVTCVGIALNIMRRSHKEETKVPEFTDEMMRLKAELRGRLSSGVAYVLGELSISHDRLEAVDPLRLRKAVEMSRRAYHELKAVGGPAEFMALNNLIFFSAVEGDQAYAGFVLEEARRLKRAGQMYSNPELLLTYCRAVLSFGKDPEERQEVLAILKSIAGNTDERESVRREARLYLAAIPGLWFQADDDARRL